MNNKKIIFIDYDGTLYNRKNNGIYEEVYQLLKKSKENDIDVFLCTGRTLLYLKNDMRLLSLLKGVIGANGTFITLDNKYIYESVISKDNIRDIYEYSNKLNLSTVYFSKEVAYVDFKDTSTYDGFKYYNPMPMINITSSNDIEKEIELICIYAPEELIDPMINIFKNLTIYKWGKSGADIVSKNTSKGNGIKIILDKYGYDFNNTYAIGDGLNDILAFKEADVSVLTIEQQEEVSPKMMDKTDYVIEDIIEVTMIDF